VSPSSPPPEDRHRLRAAEGWLQLGLPQETLAELATLSPAVLAGPEALHWRCVALARLRRCAEMLAAANALRAADPANAWAVLHAANALHWTGRTEEAYALTLAALEFFPDHWHLRYDLACYAAQTARPAEARRWLAEAFRQTPDADGLRQHAHADPDLKAMGEEIDDLFRRHAPKQAKQG
jgi:predicted Zn-dependent protease